MKYTEFENYFMINKPKTSTRVDNDFQLHARKRDLLTLLEFSIPQLTTFNPILDTTFYQELDKAALACVDDFTRGTGHEDHDLDDKPYYVTLLEHTKSLMPHTKLSLSNENFISIAFSNEALRDYFGMCLGGIQQTFSLQEQESIRDDIKKTFPGAHKDISTAVTTLEDHLNIFIAAVIDPESKRAYPLFKNNEIRKVFYSFFDFDNEFWKNGVLTNPVVFKFMSMDFFLSNRQLNSTKNIMLYTFFHNSMPKPLVDIIVDYCFEPPTF